MTTSCSALPPVNLRPFGRVAEPNLAWRLAPKVFNVAFVDSLWSADSASTEVALATIATDRFQYTYYEGADAATHYRRLSGRAFPILGMMEVEDNEAARALALYGVRQLRDETERAIVRRIACEAAWYLAAIEADTTYDAFLVRNGIDLDNAREAGAAISQALRLLDGDPDGLVKATGRLAIKAGP